MFGANFKRHAFRGVVVFAGRRHRATGVQHAVRRAALADRAVDDEQFALAEIGPAAAACQRRSQRSPKPQHRGEFPQLNPEALQLPPATSQATRYATVRHASDVTSGDALTSTSAARIERHR